jgi:hypothetical protein
MKTKIFLPILMLICISWNVSTAAIYHRYLGNLQNVEFINVCAGPNDSVVLHKPTISSACCWYAPGTYTGIYQDTVIVTYTTQGQWQFSSAEAGNDFYVFFIQNPPYQPADMAHDSVFAQGSTINWTLDAQNITLGSGYSCTYQWDNMVIGDRGLTGMQPWYRTITDTGTYWVQLTNDCGTRTDTIHVSIATTTGLVETEINTFSFYVFPNPATDIIYIKGIAGGTVRVVDIMGRVVMEEENNGEINISRLERGLYQLILTKDGITHITKVIKE